MLVHGTSRFTGGILLWLSVCQFQRSWSPSPPAPRTHLLPIILSPLLHSWLPTLVSCQLIVLSSLLHNVRSHLSTNLVALSAFGLTYHATLCETQCRQCSFMSALWISIISIAVFSKLCVGDFLCSKGRRLHWLAPMADEAPPLFNTLSA